MNFDFYMPVRIFSGEGCLRQGGGQLRTLGPRCLVVTGAHAAKACGALDDALTALEEAGIEATVFPGIGANPLLTQCQAAAFAAESCRAEFSSPGPVQPDGPAADSASSPRSRSPAVQHPPASVSR